MTETKFSDYQDGHVIHAKGRFRALSAKVDPSKSSSDIFVQEAVNAGGVGGWVDRGGYNSLSNDYAYSSAREEVDRLARKAAQ